MKKQGSLILLILTLVFGSFCAGFFVGRNFSQAPVQVSALPDPTIPSTTVPTTTETIPPTQAPTVETLAPTVETQPASEAATETSTETSAETSTEASSEPSPTDSTGLIDINTADQAALMTLPGIGEVLSQRILDYREENGPFQSVSDLLNVSGIGEKRLAAILDYICAGG